VTVFFLGSVYKREVIKKVTTSFLKEEM